MAGCLAETADEISRSECFDIEQRAEVYTILKTLQDNTESHCAMVRLLTEKMKAIQGNA